MSFDRLTNVLKRHASSQDNQAAQTKFGQITNVGPDGTTARVTIQPEGILTGWLPVGCVAVGANAIIAPPNIGDWVQLDSHEGDAENWVVTHRIFTTSSPAPSSPATSSPVKPGECAIITGGGAYIHVTADGNIHSGGTIWTHTGDLHVTGEVIRGYGGGDQVTLGQHTHNQGADSGGDSEVPTNPPNAGT